jgi:formylglycine-generating enzyme required for sulfatase activity
MDEGNWPMHRLIAMVGAAGALLAILAAPLLGQPPAAKIQSVTNSIGMKLISIPAGKFRMGSTETESERSPDEVLHEVTLTKAFHLGVHEVTQEQYSRVMGKNPSAFRGDRLPVEMVSQTEAFEFCARLSGLPAEKAAGRRYRLPTEAEWEYACRAETGSPYHFGTELNGSQANCDGGTPYGTEKKGPFLGKTCPVGTYPANAWGLHDMHGNVFEWCSDGFSGASKDPVTDPQGGQGGAVRAARGGCWSFVAEDCRAANRIWLDAEYSFNYGGLRVVMTVEEKP